MQRIESRGNIDKLTRKKIRKILFSGIDKMKTSDSIKNISLALLAFQKDISTVKKDASNPYYGSHYVTLEAVLEAVMVKLNGLGVVVIQGGHPTDKNGLSLSTRLVHAESGEFIETTLELPLVKQDPQAGGSACTYARRYSLMAMLGLGAEDDDGNNATHKPTPVQNQTKSEPAFVPDNLTSICPIHNAPMTQKNGQWGPFWSHNIDGKWCQGK